MAGSRTSPTWSARSTRAPRAILLITPNNPTGAVYSKRTLEKILELARRHNLIIFADEIYDKLIFDPNEKHISIATLATDVPVVTFNGLSKSYLVPGWRIGWAIATGPREVVHPYMEAVHRLLRARLSAPHPFQHAIRPALEGPQDHLDRGFAQAEAPRRSHGRMGEAHSTREAGGSEGRVLRASIAARFPRTI